MHAHQEITHISPELATNDDSLIISDLMAFDHLAQQDYRARVAYHHGDLQCS